MKRWILRSFFIGLLLLCVGGWVWGSFYQSIVLCSYDGYTVGVATQRGVLAVAVGSGFDGSGLHPIPNDVAYRVEKRPFQFWPGKRPLGSMFYLLGFGIVHQVEIRFDQWVLTVPFWFLIAANAALLWLVWRKTRPPVEGRAFPVEMGEKQP